ncbi:MAG: SPOR domain-containing protein [Robiginitalea sp.]|jgi:hypothetical protein
MNRIGIFCFFTLLNVMALHGQRGQISIEQDPEIGHLMNIYKEAKANADYYTIQVGFGTYDTAEQLRDEVSVEFPEYDPKIVFDSPTYRVHVGKFSNRLEAEKKFLEVRKKFPGALLLKSGNLER